MVVCAGCSKALSGNFSLSGHDKNYVHLGVEAYFSSCGHSGFVYSFCKRCHQVGIQREIRKQGSPKQLITQKQLQKIIQSQREQEKIQINQLCITIQNLNNKIQMQQKQISQHHFQNKQIQQLNDIILSLESKIKKQQHQISQSVSLENKIKELQSQIASRNKQIEYAEEFFNAECLKKMDKIKEYSKQIQSEISKAENFQVSLRKEIISSIMYIFNEKTQQFLEKTQYKLKQFKEKSQSDIHNIKKQKKGVLEMLQASTDETMMQSPTYSANELENIAKPFDLKIQKIQKYLQKLNYLIKKGKDLRGG